MKRLLSIMALGIFATSLSVWAEPTIIKGDKTRIDSDKNIVPTDSTTTIDFDGYNTVKIDFKKASDDVVVKIYKNEKLVYTDSDSVVDGTILNYEITDGPLDRDFDIVVEIDGKTDAAESIRIH